MSPLPFLQSIANWGPIVMIRDSKLGMPLVQSVHLTGLTVFLASTLAIDLRLAGAGMRDLSLSSLARQLKPWAMGALALVLLSGILIFLATPGKYLGSHPFQLKMTLLCLAILFHFGVLLRLVPKDPNVRSRRANILIAAISLTLWFGVGWSGRAIAFVP